MSVSWTRADCKCWVQKLFPSPFRYEVSVSAVRGPENRHLVETSKYFPASVVLRSCNETHFPHGNSQQGQRVPLKISLHKEMSPTCLKSQIKKSVSSSNCCVSIYLCMHMWVCIWIHKYTFIHTKTKCK